MEDLTKENLPWLVFSNHYHFLMGKFSSNGPRRVLDFSTRQERHVDFPETKGNIICGTSSGWLILIDDKSLTNITLVNPITVTKLELPRILPEQNKRFPVHKAILSSNPPNDYVVLIIYGDSKELRFYKSGRDTWTTLKETGRFWDDIISDGGKFYAVNEWGRVVSLKFYNTDSSSSSSFFDPLIEEIAMPWSFRGSKIYISMIDGQLCLIIRFVRQDKTTPDGFATTGFEIYEYISTKQHWKELFTLNGGCLFVGRNETLSLSSSFKNSFTANKIFFTDDYDDDYRMRCGRDVGEYLVSSVQTKAIRRPFDSIQLPEIWFMPSA